MTPQQESQLAALNDAWGVARFDELPSGRVRAVLDDGDRAMIEPDGSYRLVDEPGRPLD